MHCTNPTILHSGSLLSIVSLVLIAPYAAMVMVVPGGYPRSDRVLYVAILRDASCSHSRTYSQSIERLLALSQDQPKEGEIVSNVVFVNLTCMGNFRLTRTSKACIVPTHQL
jgi:hypothetical protein